MPLNFDDDFVAHEERFVRRHLAKYKIGSQRATPAQIAKSVMAKLGTNIASFLHKSDEDAENYLKDVLPSAMPWIFDDVAGGHIPEETVETIEVEQDLLARSFGAAPTMKARGELLLGITAEVKKALGKDAKAALVNAEASRQFNELALSWGASDRNLRPGVDPKAAAPVKAAARSPAEDYRGDCREKGVDNPWSETGWRGTDAQRVAAKAKLLRSLGSKACEGLAKAAGVHLLSGRPL
jgi:hypothetical protein